MKTSKNKCKTFATMQRSFFLTNLTGENYLLGDSPKQV